MEKIYIVILGISGEDWDSDTPMVCGTYKNKKDAIQCLKKTYKNFTLPGEKETTKEEEYIEETNFDADYHFIIMITEQTL